MKPFSKKELCLIALMLASSLASAESHAVEASGESEEEAPAPKIVELLQWEEEPGALPLEAAHHTVESGHDTAHFHTEEVRSLEIEVNKSVVVDTAVPITRVAVGSPKLADVTLLTERQVLVVASNSVGATNLILWHGDEVISVYEIVVMIPGSQLEMIHKALGALLPEADDIQIYISGRSLILDGQVDSQEVLDDLLRAARTFVPNVVNLIRVRGCHQVQLEVTIVEVLRSAMKQMGLSYLSNQDWGIGVLPSGDVSGTLETTGARSDVNSDSGRLIRNLGGSASASSSGSLLAGITGQASGRQVREMSSGDDFTSALTTEAALSTPYASAFKVLMQSSGGEGLAVLNLLKGQNLARTLANPTLVALSGQEASFLVGGEFPVPTNSQSDSAVSVSYRSYGIILRFMPTVVGRDTITLRVEPEVSTPDYSLGVASASVSVPGLRTRRGETTLQLRDGQTFVMAGLLTDNMSQVVNKVPFMGDLPILGSLFTSKEYQHDESELVILVRVHLVRPLAPGEVPPLPGADISHDMTDTTFFLNTPLTTKDQKNRDKTDKPLFAGARGFAH